jgi:DNA-binding HxlR family transcriptional regulator
MHFLVSVNMDKYTAKNQIYKISGREYDCPFELTTSVIMSKWKMKIVKILYEKGKIRYGQLKKFIPGKITHKMLIQSVRELEEDGIVDRIVFPEVPPHVEYVLTKNGLKLRRVIETMNEFGRNYLVHKNTNSVENLPRLQV